MVARAKINPILSSALDILLPPAHSYARQNEELDWSEVTFLDEPCCHTCGFPFEFDQGDGSLCAPCLARPPAYDQGRSAFIYDIHSRTYVLAFKHGGKTVHLDRFARQLGRAGRRFWPSADMIIPVPLHPARLVKRKFNQAALLAKALSDHTSTPFEPDILFRVKPTASQGEQTPKGRFRNVQGAFAVPETARARVQNKSIVLIDDVLTTGATVQACAKTLRRAGAQTINVLTLARVVRAQQIPK